MNIQHTIAAPAQTEAPAMPTNLQIGDILSCRLPTDYEGNGRITTPRRNVMIVGLECVPETNAVAAMHVVRFSYNVDKFQPDWEIELSLFEQKEWKIEGLNRAALLRTNRVDIVPVTPEYFPYGVEVRGRVHNPEFFTLLGERLKLGLASPDAETSRLASFVPFGAELRQTQDHTAGPIAPGFDLANLITRTPEDEHHDAFIEQPVMDDYDRALIQARRQTLAAFRAAAANAPKPQPEQQAEMTAEPAAPAPKPPRLNYAKPQDLRKGRRRKFKTGHIDAMVSHINAQVRRNREEAGLEAPRDPGHLNARAFETMKPSGPRAQRDEVAAATPFFSVAADYTPVLPPNLQRGDVVILKIADIMNPHDDRPAMRPCVVWNVYEDPETGEVAGLEVFPRTRLRAHEFDKRYTASFPNLYRRNVWDGGYLVAQRIARLPLTKDYFHPVTKKLSKPFNPVLFNELTDKRAACVEAGDTISAFGLRDLPDHWRLRESEATPLAEKAAYYAERVLAERDRQQHAIEQAPQVGDIILRRATTIEGGETMYPALVWGVWNHKITNYPAALDCMRIDWGKSVKNQWSLDLEIDPAIWNAASRPQDENWRIDTTVVDLVPNTQRFFVPGETAQVIGRVDEATMETLIRRRADTLVKNRKRRGHYPEFLRFDWTRVEGPSYGQNPANLGSSKFAPDLDYYNQHPGQLRHNYGRDKNRRGLPPRKKHEGFRKGPKIS